MTRYFVSRWLRSLPPDDGTNGWLLGIANSLPGKQQSDLGRRLFRCARQNCCGGVDGHAKV